MLEELGKIRDRLKKNPIYALSLGSRELFHSNLLGWIFEQYPDFLQAIYSGPVPENITVQREKSNFDLLIEFPKESLLAAIIVELKIKDVPRADQLEDYTEKLASLFPEPKRVKRVLLSLAPINGSIEASKNWESIELQRLGESISGIAKEANLTDTDAVIIKRYADLCLDLGRLWKIISSHDDDLRCFFLPLQEHSEQVERVDSIAEELRFADTLNKNRASALSYAIEKECDDLLLGRLKSNFAFGFSRKTPHADASVTWCDEKNPDIALTLSVSIQGKQYRRVVAFSHFLVKKQGNKDDQKIVVDFIEKTDQWNWLFGPWREKGLLDNQNEKNGYFSGVDSVITRQRKNNLICSYSPKYLYQYTVVGSSQGELDPRNIVRATKADLEFAIRLLSDSSYISRFEGWIEY